MDDSCACTVMLSWQSDNGCMTLSHTDSMLSTSDTTHTYRVLAVNVMQVQVGLWVRNGPELASLHYLYTNAFWSDTGCDLDLLLLQLWLGQIEASATADM